MIKFFFRAILSLYLLQLAHSFQACKQHITPEGQIPFSLTELEISPRVPKTGDEIRLDFSAKALKNIREPRMRLEVSVFGIPVELDEFEMCEESARGKCWLKSGETVVATIEHKLHESIPEGVKIDVRLDLFDNAVSTEFSTCVEDIFMTDERNDLLSSRFGFDEEEINFLFKKWYHTFEDDIYMPYSESSFSVLAASDRKNIFKDNLVRIATHNADGSKSWKMSMNQFGHLTSGEFKSIFASGYRSRNHVSKNLRKARSYAFNLARTLRQINLPDEINWVTEGAVTPVKNQGACGSCWSFATTGALEGAYFVKYGELISFSEQELVSCDHVDMGCGGGAMDNAFEFIKEENGICTEDSFPYTAGLGVRGFCNVTCDKVPRSAPSGFVDVAHDEESLREAVAQQPVAVAIEADEASFQFYSSGVLTAECSQKLDHGVLVVGYGTENDVDYWLVKNSWGPMWGLEGYIKIERGIEQDEGGECGILLGPSYPTM